MARKVADELHKKIKDGIIRCASNCARHKKLAASVNALDLVNGACAKQSSINANLFGSL